MIDGLVHTTMAPLSISTTSLYSGFAHLVEHGPTQSVTALPWTQPLPIVSQKQSTGHSSTFLIKAAATTLEYIIIHVTPVAGGDAADPSLYHRFTG